MSATTNTVIATVDAEVPTVPTVTTAAILIAAKGKGYAKQVKNKMEKTKNAIVGNTTDGYTLVKELYSHSMMLLQQTMFQTENTTSGEEFSTSVGKLMDCIETLSGSIQQNIASLKKIKQKLAQNNKQYIAQTIEFAAIPVDESETTQTPAAKKPRAKKVKESAATAETAVAAAAAATEGGVDDTAPAAKKPRAKKVKESAATAETDAAAAPAAKKPRAKKVKEPVVATNATEAPVAETTPAAKKPRAKKVKEPSATEPAAAAAEAPVTTEEALAEAVAQAVLEAVEQAVAEAAAPKKPRAKKTKKSSETVATEGASEDATTVTSESEQPQTETIYTVIHPEVTADSTAPKKTKKTKEPKKTNKSKQTTEPPSTPIHTDADSMTPGAPTRESIIQNDFVPNHLTFDYEITSEDICRDIELIIDELEEDMISEITAIGK